MSWLGDLGGLDQSQWTEGGEVYARGAIIAGAARAGWSGAAALGQLRSMGRGSRRQDVYRAWNTVQDQWASNQTARALDVDASSGLAIAGQPPADWTGQYVHQVTATFRTPGEDGTYITEARTLGLKSNELLTPWGSAQGAMSILETPLEADAEGGYGTVGDLVSLQLTGVWYA